MGMAAGVFLVPPMLKLGRLQALRRPTYPMAIQVRSAAPADLPPPHATAPADLPPPHATTPADLPPPHATAPADLPPPHSTAPADPLCDSPGALT
jgi:hypothetical protein